MEFDRIPLLSSPRSAEWQVWWPGYEQVTARLGAGKFTIHDDLEALVAFLVEHPEAALAIHETAQGAEVERLLLSAREAGWVGPWAALSVWVRQHSWLGRAFSEPLQITSWPEFWSNPWPTVEGTDAHCEREIQPPELFSIDQIPGPIVVLSEGRVEQCNHDFVGLVGISHDKLIGMPLVDCWSDLEQGKAFLDRLRGATARGEFFEQASWNRSDHRMVSVELRCRSVSFRGRIAVSWVIAVQDVSRQQRALEFLQVQRELVECATNAIVIVEVTEELPQARICFVNPEWEKLTGFSAEETIGMSWSILDPAGPSKEFSAQMDRLIHECESAFITLSCRNRTGAEFWADISLFPLRSEGVKSDRFVAIFRDVTQRVEVDARLTESEHRFRLLFSENRLPMFLHDEQNGRIVDSNSAASAFSGYDRDHLIGKHLDELCLDGPNPSDDFDVEKVSNAVVPTSRAHRHADGSVRYVIVYPGLFQIEQESVRYSILVDVTAQREAETRLLEALEKMHLANEAKSEFLQVMGHEIRTPMNAILGFSELLRSADSDQEREDCLDMVEAGTRDLLQVIDSVVEYIELSSEVTPEDFIAVDLPEYLRLIADPFINEAKAKGVVLNVSISDKVSPNASLPRLHFQKMLTILLSNAVKFTESGWICLHCSAGPTEETLELSVSDSGVGFSKEAHESIFKPFTSSDMSTEREHNGLGLGLARCQRLSEVYGGGLSCQSIEGEGSTFTLILPYQATRL